MASPSPGESSARTLEGPHGAEPSREASGSTRRSRGRLHAWLLLAGATSVAFCYGVAGCANDFDALFPSDSAGTTPPPSGSGLEAGVDSGPGSRDGGSDEDGAATCGPPMVDCVNDDDEKEDDERKNRCSGCQCPCSFACENKDGRKCSTTCTGGSSCATTCKSDECRLGALASTGKLTCTDRAKKCELTCEQGSHCELTCANTGSCTATCAEGSQCVVQCPLSDAGKPERCDVTCVGGGEALDCPRGIKTCNQACPP